MHQVPHEHVRQLRAATDTSMRTNAIDPTEYAKNLGYLERQKMPDVFYLFSLPQEWDVLEVKKENEDSPILRRRDSELHIGPIEPNEHGTVVRTLVLTPASTEAETRAMLGLPRWDRFIRVTGVLTADDRYFPLSATYIGSHDRPVNVAKLASDALAVLSSPEFKTPIQVPAPPLPPVIAEWEKILRTERVTGHHKERFIADLMALDDDTLIEAVGRLLPVAERHNEWFQNEQRIAERTWNWKLEHPEYEGTMVTAPWKTGRILPRHYDPRVGFRTAEPMSPQQIPF